MAEAVVDWDKAYANAASIADAQAYMERWPLLASEFRDSANVDVDIPYGTAERNRFDLFRPDGASRGLFVFVHGGYWYRFDKSFWSQLAAGPLARGWTVAIPSYTLTPQARVRDITWEIAAAVNSAAGMVTGPVVLAGHSAGGHLVSRQVCTDNRLEGDALGRITRVISVSGVHDLRPVTRLEINQTIGLDDEEATDESPALRKPVEGARIDCVVGGSELPEFLRQNALLANVWTGLGAVTSCHEIPDTHHFNVIETLADPDGLICSLAEED